MIIVNLNIRGLGGWYQVEVHEAFNRKGGGGLCLYTRNKG